MNSLKQLSISMSGTCVLMAMACGHDATSPSTSPLYWRLQLNHHAVTLATVAPYDTIRLTATPVDVTGAPILTTGRPLYTISDTSLTIDSTGLVHVHWTGSDALNIQVVAKLTLGETQSATLADTTIFNVINVASASAVPTLDSLIFRPVAGDSARRALSWGQPVTQVFDNVFAKTAAGTAIPNVVVRYRSSDSSVARFTAPTSTTAPEVQGIASGVTLLTAEATVYGKRRVDSLRYVVGYPLQSQYDYGIGGGGISRGFTSFLDTASNVLSSRTLRVGLGAAVLWQNSIRGVADDSLDIQFDDSTNVLGLTAPMSFPAFLAAPIAIPPGPGGNIAAFPAAIAQIDSEPPYDEFSITFRYVYDSTTSKARVFTRLGTYRWTSRHQGIAGAVIVVSNDSLQSNNSINTSLSRSR